MAAFGIDTCTDADGTSLQAHTPTGSPAFAGPWISSVGQYSGTNLVKVLANRLYCTSVEADILTSDPPPGADYWLTWDMYVPGTPIADAISLIAARTDNAFRAGYGAGYDMGSGSWVIETINNPSGITPIASAAASLTNGQTYACQFVLVGTSLVMNVDGAQVLSVTNGTTAAAGLIGLVKYNDGTATGLHFDNIQAGTGTPPGGAAPAIYPPFPIRTFRPAPGAPARYPLVTQQRLLPATPAGLTIYPPYPTRYVVGR